MRIRNAFQRPWLVPLVSFLLVVVWVVWRTGFDKVPPYPEFERIAANWPTSHLPSGEGYVLRLPLGQIIYRLTGTRSIERFLLIHEAAAVVDVAMLVSWLCVRLGLQRGAIAASVVALAPITSVLMRWIGIYDPFSIFVLILVVFSLHRGRAVQFLVAVLAGFQDFEQVAVALILLWCVPPLVERAKVRPSIVAGLAGAGVGKVAIEGYLRADGTHAGNRLSAIADPTVLSDMASGAATLAPIVIFSALGGLWGFAFLAVRQHWRRWPSAIHWRLIAGVVLWFAVAVITYDHTRVLALTSFPCVVLAAIVIADSVGNFRTLWRQPEWWLLLLAPPVIVWQRAIIPVGLQFHPWHYWLS